MFKKLVEMAADQPEPQRLLFLFAKAEGNNPKKSKKMQKGHIEPVMCVDKLVSELSTFNDLVVEANTIEDNWQFIFIAGLSGKDGVAPTSNDAEPYLNQMTNDVVAGNNIAKYVVLDKDENPIEMMVN